MIKRILVGIADPAYTVSATRHAIDIARRCDASLTGVSILDVETIRRETAGVLLGDGGYSSSVRQATFDQAGDTIERAVDAFVRLCDEAAVKYEFFQVAGDPIQELVTRSKYHDLMIGGLHRLFEHGVLPEPQNGLARLVSAGVRPILATAEHHSDIQRVLVAYSNSVESAKTMRRFTQLSPLVAPGAEVRVVSFGKQKQGDGPVGLIETRDYMQAHGLNPRIEFLTESPRTGVLAQASEWNANLVVLGNSGKSLLRRRVFGETALHTIRNASVPLFLSQ